MYDTPEVYADMVHTLAELTCWSIDQIVPRALIPQMHFEPVGEEGERALACLAALHALALRGQALRETVDRVAGY